MNLLRRAYYGPEGEQNPGQWIHNLEHGYVVGLYSCRNGCPSGDELAQLQRFQNEAPKTEGADVCVPPVPNKVIVARFDQMSTRFALIAWDRALLTDTFDVEAAKTFAQQHVDSPQAPERFSQQC